MTKVIVADAGPLIALASTNHLPVLAEIAGSVVVTRTVFTECTAEQSKPGASQLLDAMANGGLQTVADPDLTDFDLDPRIDTGEATAIRLAIRMSCTVLIDDLVAREFAHRKGLNVVGSAGILLAGKGRGLVTVVMPVLATCQELLGYRFSDSFLKKVRELAAE